MENNMIKSQKNEAVELDLKIKTYANMAWQNLMESAKCLKQMRDTKLYLQLGYESFEDYSVKSLNIKERQAYTYISAYEKLGERFLQSNASLGITKLSLLSQVPPTERENLVDSNDIGNMSVEEVKKLVEENDAKGKQISMLEEELAEEKEENSEGNRMISNLEDKVKRLEEELSAERLKPVEVAVEEPNEEQMNKIRTEIEAKVKKSSDAELKKAKKELTDKFNSEKEKALAEAEEKAKNDVKKYKEKLAELDEEKAQAIKRAENLEKELAVSSSPETVKFTFYFDSLNSDYEKIFESIEKLKEENPEMAQKYTQAMIKYQEIIGNRIGKIVNEEK